MGAIEEQQRTREPSRWRANGERVESLAVSAFTVPTEQPEADGTLTWDCTTLVLVEVSSGGRGGLGWTYADAAAARLVHDRLREHVVGREVADIGAIWLDLVHGVRNLGRPGLASMAISAVDMALWDLKAHLYEVALTDLFGAVRDRVAVYGSGGFCSYDEAQLRDQLGGWVTQQIRRVKMKVGRDPAHDLERVRAARAAIGDAELFVDANGAYDVKQALALGQRFAAEGVRWLEEPVGSDDLAGLADLRHRLPLAVAAGEYGYDVVYFRRMLEARAVDVLQVDATRCGGFTGFLQAAALCDGFALPLSAHGAPALHAHVACAAPRLRHVEWFHDHVRVERLLFDGGLQPADGWLIPDRARPGLGLELKHQDAARYRVAP